MPAPSTAQPRAVPHPHRRAPRWAVLAAVLLLAGCAGLTQPWTAPEVMLTSVAPERVTLTEQTLRLGLRIRNPNDRMLPIKAMSWRLSLEGDEIATGSGALERQIPAFGEETAELTVTASAADLAAKLPLLMLQSRPLRWQLKGTVTVAGVVPLPYRWSGELDPRALSGALR